MNIKYIRIQGNKDKASLAFCEGCFIAWTNKNVKNAFAFGNGTIKELKRFASDNVNYETIIDIDTLTYVDTGKPCNLDRKTINQIFSKYNVNE